MYEVETILRVRDLATAPLQRFAALLRETQAAVAELAGSLRAMTDLTGELAGAQRETLALTQREATARAAITSEVAEQSQVLVAARAESLRLTTSELAAQREMLAVGRERMSVGGGLDGGGGGRGGGLLGGMPSGGPAGWAVHTAIGGAKLAGEVGVGLVGDTLYEAGKLQQTLTQVKVATGASNAQIDRIRELSYDVSNATAQSVAQSASVVATIASAGINDPKKLSPAFVMDIAKFADVQYLKSHGSVSFDQAAKQAIQLAHQYGAYTPKAIMPILDEVTKASFMMPDDLQKYIRQSSYYAKLFGRFGVPQNQTLLLGAWLDRAGGASKGGTWLQDLLLQTQRPLNLTGHVQRGRAEAAQHFGLVDAHGNYDPKVFGFNAKTGHPTTDMFGLLGRLNDTIAKDSRGRSPRDSAAIERADLQKFNALFGMQGARAAYLADPQGMKSLFDMMKQLKTLPGVNQAQSMFMQTFDSQSVRAWSNFQSLLTEVGAQALPGATKGLTDLGNALHDAQHWLHQHGALELQVQRDITAGVKGVERYLIANRGTWLMFGHDLKTVYTQATKLGPDLKQVADAFGAVYKAAHQLSDGLDKFNNKISGNAAWFHKILGLPERKPGDETRFAGSPKGAKGRGPWDLGPGPLKSFLDHVRPGWDTSNYETQRQRAVQAGQHASITIHVDARGARREDAEHVARAVEKGARRALAFSQHQLRTSAAPVHLPPHMILGFGGGTGALT